MHYSNKAADCVATVRRMEFWAWDKRFGSILQLSSPSRPPPASTFVFCYHVLVETPKKLAQVVMLLTSDWCLVQISGRTPCILIDIFHGFLALSK
jgi:hypothetical protein